MPHLSYSEEALRWRALRGDHGVAVDEAQASCARSAHSGDARLIVLDDDPTGSQTVHDLPVYTDWSVDTLREAFAAPDPVFYILTNSRALSEADTTALHRELAANCCEAAGSSSFRMVSRSDSTLRGHYPLETDILDDTLSAHGYPKADGVILAPFFEAGGRFTIGDTHYVRYGDDLVPAAETEFAKDETFGYSYSELPRYVEEKTRGRFHAGDCLSIGLDILCAGDAARVCEILMQAHDGAPVIVNAIDPADMRVFCAGLYMALERGRHFLYRTAADFVKAMGAITDRPLLNRQELMGDKVGAGLIIVGSHTAKTTAQLERLKGLAGTELIPFMSSRVLDGQDALEAESERVRLMVDDSLLSGVTPVVYTERTLLEVPGDTGEEALRRSVAISAGLCAVGEGLTHRPSFIIAKGGITSSDMAVRTLRIRRGWVMGQILPGIPVWRTGDESIYPGIPYIIFPGNVGDEDALYRIVKIMIARE